MSDKFTKVIILLNTIIFLWLISGCTPGKAQLRNNPDSKYENQNFNDSNFDENNEFGDESVKSQGFNFDNNDNNSNYNKNKVKRNPEEYREPDNRYVRNSRYENVRSMPLPEENTDNTYKRKEYYQTGNASWYGREFHGKVTASGERFDMNQFTAAHKQLPFGTVLEITNFDNGKVTTVRINDRGPYRGKRIIDLSYEAAKKLGMTRTGIATVGIRIIRKGYDVTENESDNSSDNSRYKERRSRYIEPVVRFDYDSDTESIRRSNWNYSVQAGAFYSKRNAEQLKSRIEELTKKPVTIINEGDLFKVRIERIESKPDAGKYKRMLDDENIESFVLEK